MKQTKRAERRHHRNRLLKKRVLEARDMQFCFPRDETWVQRYARQRVNTSCLCSCCMCKSPRKFHGNGKNGKTFAELRICDTMRDDLQDN
jgi:hypothetical protein